MTKWAQYANRDLSAKGPVSSERQNILYTVGGGWNPWRVHESYKMAKLISNNIYVYLKIYNFRRKIRIMYLLHKSIKALSY